MNCQENGKNGTVKSFIIYFFIKLYKGDQNRDNDTGRTCSTHGGDGKFVMVQHFSVITWKEFNVH